MRKLFLLLASLFVAMTMNAQVDLSFGPKLGYQSLLVTRAEYDINQISDDSYTLGVFGRATINKFVIQPELMYCSYEFSLLKVNNYHHVDVSNQSLALPIYLGYNFFENDHIKLRANLGPVFYFSLKDTFIMDNNELDLNDDYTYSMLKHWVHKDVVVGAAVNIGVDFWNFVLDFNYSLGLTNMFHDRTYLSDVSYSSIDYEPYKQQVFTFTLGYKIF